MRDIQPFIAVKGIVINKNCNSTPVTKGKTKFLPPVIDGKGEAIIFNLRSPFIMIIGLPLAVFPDKGFYHY